VVGNVLQVKGLMKSYGSHRVLKGVDLTAEPGQIVGLLGANGAGKTTLVSIVTGLITADGGEVLIDGVDALHNRRRVAPKIGLAPQELGFYPTLTVAGNLRFFARLAGLRGAEVGRRVTEVAELLGLTEKLPQKADSLSGGQKRRLHTGMAVLHRPELMFLDEPTVGADVRSRGEILRIVREMAEQGAAVVYTTHYLTELEELDAYIAILHEGEIIARGPLHEIINRYATASAALRFNGPVPTLRGWRADGNALVPVGSLKNPGAAAADALSALGDEVHTLTGVEITNPSLESAYLNVTGRPLHLEEDRDLVS
jgi:ABC-2 type transport system ATP-binding protein